MTIEIMGIQLRIVFIAKLWQIGIGFSIDNPHAGIFAAFGPVHIDLIRQQETDQ